MPGRVQRRKEEDKEEFYKGKKIQMVTKTKRGFLPKDEKDFHGKMEEERKNKEEKVKEDKEK